MKMIYAEVWYILVLSLSSLSCSAFSAAGSVFEACSDGTITSIKTDGPGSNGTIIPPISQGNRQACKLTITACDNCKLELFVKLISFSPCHLALPSLWSSCVTYCNDYIILHEPHYQDTAYKYLYKHTASNVTAQPVLLNYTSLTKQILLEFCTSATATYEIKYVVKAQIETHVGYNDGGGSLTSPDFPHGYVATGDVYRYVIDNQSPGYIRLWFTDWHIYEGSRITIYHSDESAEAFSVNRTGVDSRPFVMSSEHKLIIVFETGSDTYHSRYLGFRAQFNFTYQRTWPDKPYNTDCGKYYSITWGGDFAFSADTCPQGMIIDCIWVINRYSMVSFNEYVWVQIYDVNLRSDDLLEIRSGNTSQGTSLKTNSHLISQGDEFFEQEALYIHLRLICNPDRIFKVAFTSYDNAQQNSDKISYSCPYQDHNMCQNKRCIAHWLTCDGINHCGDWSDETNCQDGIERHCYGTDHFACQDNSGYYCSTTKCDGRYDCDDGTDERDCWYFSTTQHTQTNQADHYYWGTITPVVLICLILGIVTCIVISYYVRRKRMLRERTRNMNRARLQVNSNGQNIPTEEFDPGVYGMMPPTYEEAVTASYVHGEGNVNIGFETIPTDFPAMPPPYTPKCDDRLPIRFLPPYPGQPGDRDQPPSTTNRPDNLSPAPEETSTTQSRAAGEGISVAPNTRPSSVTRLALELAGHGALSGMRHSYTGTNSNNSVPGNSVHVQGTENLAGGGVPSTDGTITGASRRDNNLSGNTDGSSYQTLLSRDTSPRHIPIVANPSRYMSSPTKTSPSKTNVNLVQQSQSSTRSDACRTPPTIQSRSRSLDQHHPSDLQPHVRAELNGADNIAFESDSINNVVTRRNSGNVGLQEGRFQGQPGISLEQPADVFV